MTLSDVKALPCVVTLDVVPGSGDMAWSRRATVIREPAAFTILGLRSPAVIGWSQLNAVRGDLVVDGAGVAGDGGRVCVDLVEEQFQGAGDAP